jgi:uncharacterized protein
MRIVDNTELGRFEATDGDQTAIAWYKIDGDTITFTRTELPEQLRGKGIGDALARAALEAAREKHMKVVPQCPFIAAYIHRHPEAASR